MAALLWGKVYYQNAFAGFLRQEPGFGSSFAYDTSYLETDGPAIAHSLPKQATAHVYQTELPPFFDNLVAEGWLEQAQSRLLGKRQVSRFELLLAFGFDCAGAVSVIDPNPEKLSDKLLNIDDPKEAALLTSRASLSGIQPKLAIIEKNAKYFPAAATELSNYIAIFPSDNHFDLVANEYLSSLAFKALLPDENFAKLKLGKIQGFDTEVLLIKRFDREPGKRIHFEEFNQLLNQPSNNKYFGSYEQMANFLQTTLGCLKTEIYHLYLRILAGILLGNTDMHLKNFAMLHTNDGLRLAPVYDQVCALAYGYKNLALTLNKQENLVITKLQANDIITLGLNFGLNNSSIKMAINTLSNNFVNAKQTVLNANHGSDSLKYKIVELMEKLWKQIFASIG